MSNIFEEDSDTELTFKTDNQYAKKYDQWRTLEELNKLKTKYQNDLDSGNSSSESDDDEEGKEITEQVEKDFFKTLAYLKSKDPKIYDENVRFFDDENTEKTPKKSEKSKKTSIYLKDYERNLILEKGGILSDEEDENDHKNHSPTYVEEQSQAKENLKSVLNSLDDQDEGDKWGGIFKKREKTEKEREMEENDYKQWLAGQKDEIGDEQIGTDLRPLKEFWNNPNLDEGEKFLRDYILNKQFLNKDNEDYIPTYDEIVHDSDELSNDETMLEKQEEFEHKYNFRFEEPDQEFIKRYPRTVENSLRRKDDKRKQKRQELKERKHKEKEMKMQDLKKLQELKKKEIEEKLDKLKEITGNTTLGFADEDIEEEFDPEKYDKRMQALFSEEFYDGPEGDQKPEFPDLDKELEIENWNHDYLDTNNDNEDYSLHCEDENFNMNCDYDPNAPELEKISAKSKKKHKRKSKFAEAISQPKPKFDPNDKRYEEYLDEYYKLDCEDFIGDIPCRFKYRKVVPNDFGLATEEILLAKERELNKWCSLKKAIQIRPDHVEKYDQIAYKKKAQNIALKKKILPSLFAEEEKDDSSKISNGYDNHTKIINKDEVNCNGIIDTKQNKKRRHNGLKKGGEVDQTLENVENEIQNNDILQKTNEEYKDINITSEKKVNKKKRKKNKKLEASNKADQTLENSQDKKQSNGVLQSSVQGDDGEPPKKRPKPITQNLTNKVNEKPNVSQKNAKSLKKKKRNNKKNLVATVKSEKKSNKSPPLKKTNIKKVKDCSPLAKISNERLSAYGIKKKKFKNKLKYKK